MNGYGYAEVDTDIDAGVVNGSIGGTYRDSVNAAHVALMKERRYQMKRLQMLCRPARLASNHDGMVISAPGKIAQNRLLTYAVVGIVGYALLRGLMR